MPYDYDAVMGITRVGTREAEGFDEDLDSTEYHDANDTTEEPIRKEETLFDTQVLTSTGVQGGYGSSSLKECIELLNTTSRIAPAPLDSGVGDSADPPQFPLHFPLRHSDRPTWCIPLSYTIAGIRERTSTYSEEDETLAGWLFIVIALGWCIRR